MSESSFHLPNSNLQAKRAILVIHLDLECIQMARWISTDVHATQYAAPRRDFFFLHAWAAGVARISMKRRGC